MIFIANSDNFLKRVAGIVLEKIRELKDPLQILQMRVYLPNNRSCRILKEYLIGSKKTLILPKILTPFESESVDHQIQEIIKIVKVLDNNTYVTSKFNLACSLYSEIKNIIQEKLPLKKATSANVNPQMVNLLNKITVDINMRSIESNTEFISQTKSSCICAGFTYSHAYLRDFLKAAVHANKHTMIFQRNPDIYGLSHKLLKYIGADDSFNTESNTLHNTKINIIEPPNKLNEIKTISTIVRSKIGKRITIIYTDKALIAGVKAYLQKWNINIDDSSGLPFKNTREATIFLLLLQVIISNFSINEMLELLKFATSDDLNNVEKTALLNRANLSATPIQLLLDTGPIIPYLMNMSSIFHKEDIALQSAAFEQCFFFILNRLDLRGSDIIKNIFNHLHELLPHISSLSEYYSLALKIMAMYSTRSPIGYTPNVIAVGPLEAQLINSDITIIAGFNDKNWIADSDQYIFDGHEALSQDLECRKNNDIYNTLYHAINSSDEVFFTNAVVDDSTQQKLCRLIYSFLKQDDIDIARRNGALWNFEDNISVTCSLRPVAVIPDIQDRPTVFSVSDIELLMKNPYAFYAKKILRLLPLHDILAQDYANRLKGTILHNALRISNSSSADDMSKKVVSNVHSEIKRLGLSRYHFLDWIFKIENIAKYAAQHASGANFIEYPGSIELNIGNQIIKIKCIADAIICKDNQLTIIDYKTGSLPTYQDILSLNKPQMLVEAVIAIKNGFYNIQNCSIDKLMFIQLGGAQQSLKAVNIMESKSLQPIDKVLQSTIEKLLGVIYEYTIGLKSFIANGSEYYDEYAHFDREKEWRAMKT